MLGTIADAIMLNARLNLGARVGLSGKLDVQLIRGENDDAWVDVGMDQQAIRAFSVAVTTGWGVAGLPQANLDLGVRDLNLTKIAEKALQKQLNTHLNASLSATTSSSSLRLTVARFKSDTSRGEDVEQALAQAMRGDVRVWRNCLRIPMCSPARNRCRLDELAGILRDLDEPEGFVIAYALLWLASPANVEVMANYMFDQDNDRAFPDLTVYGRGTAPMIDAGQFDLDQIIGAR